MTLTFFLLSLFTLGAAHALEPGHGKLLVTSYLAGTNARTKDAVLLGGLVAFFHTLSVAMIGVLVVFLAMTFFKDILPHALELLSGVVILGLGLVLFWRRFITPSSVSAEHCDCPMGHAVDHDFTQQLPPEKAKTTLKEVVWLGLASGITPCPMALAALIAAMAMGKPLSALGALVVFSLGIGSVLMLIGLALIKGNHQLRTRWQRFALAPVWVAKVSTILVLLLGCYLVAKPLLIMPSNMHMDEGISFMMPVTSR